jgi:hypothetical protein
MSTTGLARFVAILLASGATLLARQDAAVVPSGGATSVDWPVHRGDPKGNDESPLVIKWRNIRVRPLSKS